MKKLRVMVCGVGFGRYYIEAILRLPDMFELVGILSRGSKNSIKLAEKYSVPLMTNIEKISKENVDVACVVVKSSIVGGNGTDIVMELLEKRLRGTCNIVEELHRCVENLGYCKYYILAHSISGLYCLEWCRQYEKEVEGFIGIDISVPGMEEANPCPIKTSIICRILLYKNWIFNIVGINRLLFLTNPNKIIHLDKKYQYSKEEMGILETLCINDSINKTMLAEINQLDNNLLYAEAKKIPESIPVYQFISSANCKIIPAWKELHIQISVTDNPIIILEGSHYLHLEQKDAIVNHIIKWTQALAEEKYNRGK